MKTLSDAAWPPLALPEAPDSPRASAYYGRAENISVAAVVILELTLRDVKGRIFRRYLVIGADYGALKDALEAFDCLGVIDAREFTVIADILTNGNDRHWLRTITPSTP